jgi:branched-chain amino acid transport system substrate-binding protein
MLIFPQQPEEVCMKKLFFAAMVLAAVGLSAQTVIKIASQSPLSGGQAGQGEQIKLGAQLAIEEAVPAFKKLGFDLQFVPYDDQGDPTTGVANANLIINDPDILGVVGHLNSGVVIPSSEVYNRTGLVVVSPVNTNPKVTDRNLPDVNRICGRDDIQGPAAADFAVDVLKAKKIFVLNTKTTYGAGIAAEFVKRLSSKGITVPGNANIGTEELANFVSVITQIQAYAPDLIYFGGEYQAIGPFTKQLRERGIKTPILSDDAIESGDYIKAAGAANSADTYYTTVAGPLDQFPKSKAFATNFQAKYSKVPEGYAVYSYDCANILIQAILAQIKAAGGKKPSIDAVTKAVRAIKYDGLTGPVAFDSKGDRTSSDYFILKYAGTENLADNKVFKKISVAAPKLAM